MWKQYMIIIFLLLLGMWDVRKCAVPVWLLRLGVVLSALFGVLACMAGERSVPETLAGMLPGAVLLLVALLTKKAGCADGIVLVSLGILLGYRESLFLMCGSLLLLSVFSGVLLCLRKVNRSSRLPYLPFVGMMYFLQVLLRMQGAS